MKQKKNVRLMGQWSISSWRRIWVVGCLLTAVVSLSAQVTMREAWLSMPDSLLPYLNKNLRLEHVDFVDMNVPSEVKNLLQGEGRLDTLTANYVSLRLNESRTLQMRLFTRTDSTQFIALVNTFHAPEPESTLRFFTTDWHPVTNVPGLPDLSDPLLLFDKFFECNDTVSATELEQLKRMVDPVMISISLPVDEESIILQLSSPFLLKDEKMRLDGVLVQTKFNWIGDLFKECE